MRQKRDSEIETQNTEARNAVLKQLETRNSETTTQNSETVPV